MDLAALVRPRRLRVLKYLELESIAQRCSAGEQDRVLFYLAIESANLWAQFCRSYVIECCRGATSLAGSYWYAPRLRAWRRADIRAELIRRYSRAKKPNPLNPLHEPLWRDITVVERCCREMDVKNLSAVQVAIGLAPSFLRELQALRNFAAHKCENTRAKIAPIAQQRGQFGLCNLRNVMLMPVDPAGGGSVTRQWLVEIDNLMVAMCG